MQQEIHTLQTRSKTDKSTWLSFAEDQRLLFCLSYCEFEGSILKDKADRSQMECILDDDDSISIETLKRTMTLGVHKERNDETSLNASMNSNGIYIMRS